MIKYILARLVLFKKNNKTNDMINAALEMLNNIGGFFKYLGHLNITNHY
jgi:hypothetical protein